MRGLQHFEEARNLFPGGAAFQWDNYEVTRELVGEACIGTTWAGIVASCSKRISSTVELFSLKHDLIRHIATARAFAEAL